MTLIHGVWNKTKKELTFADGTPFEKEFYKGRLPFFKCDFFTYHIQKIDFYIIKKYVCIANNFASQKMYLFRVIQLNCSLFNVYNNLNTCVRGICTSDKNFLFK